MTIRAQFASVCPCCNARIAVGSKVEWSRGTKARHVACPARTAAPAARSAPRGTWDGESVSDCIIREGSAAPAAASGGASDPIVMACLADWAKARPSASRRRCGDPSSCGDPMCDGECGY